MTSAEARQIIAAWRVLWPNARWNDDDARLVLAAWSSVMADITYAEAEHALVAISKSGAQFPPPPGQIVQRALEARAALDGTLPPALDLALREVRFYIGQRGAQRPPERWSHPAIAEAVAAIGWSDLCAGGDTTRAHFMRAYESARARHLSEPSRTPELQSPL